MERTLLPKIETNLHIGMSSLQRQWYAKVLSREVEVLNANSAQNKGKAGKLPTAEHRHAAAQVLQSSIPGAYPLHTRDATLKLDSTNTLS